MDFHFILVSLQENSGIVRLDYFLAKLSCNLTVMFNFLAKALCNLTLIFSKKLL